MSEKLKQALDMVRSGTAGTPSGKPQPSNPQSGFIPAVPEPTTLFKSYGLRQGSDGLQVCEVSVRSDGTCTVRQLRQGEPQRAVAFAYLEATVEHAYVEG